MALRDLVQANVVYQFEVRRTHRAPAPDTRRRTLLAIPLVAGSTIALIEFATRSVASVTESITPLRVPAVPTQFVGAPTAGILLPIFLCSLAFLVGAKVAYRTAHDRSTGVLDDLRLTLLTPLEIVIGRIASQSLSLVDALLTGGLIVSGAIACGFIRGGSLPGAVTTLLIGSLSIGGALLFILLASLLGFSFGLRARTAGSAAVLTLVSFAAIMLLPLAMRFLYSLNQSEEPRFRAFRSPLYQILPLTPQGEFVGWPVLIIQTVLWLAFIIVAYREAVRLLR